MTAEASSVGTRVERLVAGVELRAMVYRCLNDSDWTMLEVSPGCRTVTGYPPEAVLGNATLSYASLIVPEDRIQVSATVQEALAEHRPFQLHYRIRHADGSTRQVWEQGWGRYDGSGRLDAIEGVIVDAG